MTIATAVITRSVPQRSSKGVMPSPGRAVAILRPRKAEAKSRSLRAVAILRPRKAEARSRSLRAVAILRPRKADPSPPFANSATGFGMTD